MLPATEDKEDLASIQWAAQLDDGLQLIQEQQQIVVTTDAVREDGYETTVATSAQEEERCLGPNSFPAGGGAQVEDVQPQVQQFNWLPN